MNNRLKILLLLLCGTCTGLLLAEGIIRIAFPSRTSVLKLHQLQESERGKFARYDPLLGWDGLENAADTFEWVDTRHSVLQHGFGYRGKEYAIERTDKQRALVLGDSFTWGFGVDNRDIFTSVMEQELDQGVEIVNMGVSGYGSDQEYLLWREKGRRWQPDDVLVMVSLFTDLWDNISQEKHGYPKPIYRRDERGDLQLSNVPVPRREDPWEGTEAEIDIQEKYWMNLLYTHSAFANLFMNVLARNGPIRTYLESHHVIPRRTPGYQWEYSIYSTRPKKSMEQTWTVFFGLIEMMNAAVRQEGARLVLVNIPSVVQVYPALWEDIGARISEVEGYDLDPEYPNKRVAHWCDGKGIRFIDLLPGMRRAGEANPYLYYPVNRHWTRDGHRVVAAILIEELQWDASDREPSD